MGKTIMISALIQTSLGTEEKVDESASSKQRQLKLNNAFRPSARRKRGPERPSATLIVAPTALLNQWAEEVERSSKPGTVSAILWHGQNREDLESATEPDDDDKTIKVVITSYGTLASEHTKSEKSASPVYESEILFWKPGECGLMQAFEVEWLRIVLDEAHSCKSRTSKTAKAVYALKARRRWAVTGEWLRFVLLRMTDFPSGTPIVNKLEDLYSLLWAGPEDTMLQLTSVTQEILEFQALVQLFLLPIASRRSTASLPWLTFCTDSLQYHSYHTTLKLSRLSKLS